MGKNQRTIAHVNQVQCARKRSSPLLAISAPTTAWQVIAGPLASTSLVVHISSSAMVLKEHIKRAGTRQLHIRTQNQLAVASC